MQCIFTLVDWILELIAWKCMGAYMVCPNSSMVGDKIMPYTELMCHRFRLMNRVAYF